MKDDLKDILSIPHHIYNSEKNNDKDEKNKSKDESRKNNMLSKDIFSASRSLFPIKISKMMPGSKKNLSKYEGEDNGWVMSHVKYDEEDDNSIRPNIVHWIQQKNINKIFKYKKFDIPLEIPTFTSDEYDMYLSNIDSNWKKEETLYLWELLELYELRFNIVYDRYDTIRFPRSLEDIKLRFYTIVRELSIIRGDKNSPFYNYVYDINYEKHRKHQLEKYILRGKEKNDEEKALNEELRKVDLLIKKKEREQKNLKRMMSLTKENENGEKMQDMIDQVENLQHSIFNDSEKCVYMRGSIMHGGLPSLSSKLNKKIESVMKELSIPDKPMPTKHIHGLYDNLRRNILKMFSLQISLKNKEDEKKRLQDRIDRERQIELESQSNLNKRVPDSPHMDNMNSRSNKKIKK